MIRFRNIRLDFRSMSCLCRVRDGLVRGVGCLVAGLIGGGMHVHDATVDISR